MHYRSPEPSAEWQHLIVAFAGDSERATAVLAGDILSETLQ